MSQVYIENEFQLRSENGVLKATGGIVTSIIGTTSQIIDGTGALQLLTTSIVPEGSNLYFTTARARASISLTTTGTSGAATYISGVLNIPQYQTALTNPVTGSGTNNYIVKFTTTGSTIGDSLIYSGTSGVTVGSSTVVRAFNIYSATADNQLLIAGAAPSVSLADALTGATYQAKFGLATSSNNFVTNAVAGDFAISSQGTSNILFGINGVEAMRVFGSTKNVSIGGNSTDLGFKLYVNGTSNIVGQLTLGSTITNGTYTYTLPSATGTLALISDISTGYVPYTGATSNVNLGTKNIYANAIYTGFSAITASGTQVVLTVNSAPEILVSGSGGQTIKLPDATTLSNGTTYSFNNNQSSGAITINNNSNTLVVSVPSGGYAEVILLDNSIAAGSWDRHFQAPANVSWSTNTFDYPGSITSATWNGNVIAINRGGTGSSTQNFVDLTTTQTIGGAKTFSSALTASSLIKTGGTSSQFLKADGSVDSSSYITLASLSATSPLSYNNTTGVFSIQVANTSQSGYLTSTDWTTFNSKTGGLGTSGQIAYFNGTSSITSNAAFAFTPTTKLLVNNIVTASSGTGVGTSLTSTITPQYGGDNLIGLDVAANYLGGISTLGAVSFGSGYTLGTYTNVPINGASGTSALATINIYSGYMTFAITTAGSGYSLYETISMPNTYIGGTGSGLLVSVDVLANNLNPIAIRANGSISIPYDNVSFTVGNNADIGIVKKPNNSGFFAYGLYNDFSIVQSDAATVYSKNNFTSRVVIKQSTGNVLINQTTDNGTDKLQVTGSSKFTGNVTTDGTFVSNNATLLTNGTTGGVSITSTNNRVRINGGVDVSVTNLSAISGSLNIKNAPGGSVTSTGSIIDVLATINGGASAGIANVLNLSSPQSTQASGDMRIINISPTFTKDAGTGVSFRGIYYNPNISGLTSGFTHNAYENTSGNVLLGTTSGETVIGSSTTSGAKLTINGSVTAVSAIARGANLKSTLVAAANSDVLVGLDINPTFTNGAFTGVQNLGLRVAGPTVINSGLGNVSTSAFEITGSNGSLLRLRGYGDLYLDGASGNLIIGSSNYGGGGANILSAVGTGTSFFRVVHNNGNNAIRAISNGVVELNPVAGAVLLGTTTDNGTDKLQVTGSILSSSNIKGNSYIVQTNGNGINAASNSVGIVSYGANAVDSYVFSLNNNIATANSNRNFFTLGNDPYLVYAFSSGTNTINTFRVSPTYNITGGTTTARGIYYAPTLTSLTGTTHIALETVSGNNLLGTTSGSVGIGATSTINASAILQVTSTTQGILPPRMTTTQRDAIATPATGLQVYNTTTNTNDFYNGSAWASGASGTYVTSVTGTSPIVSSGGTTPAISIPVATTSVNGYLSSTDWTTFNNKQAALTNPITGTGTSGQIAYFNGTSSLTSSATFTYSPTAVHLINNSVTASSAIARGTNLTPTLTAAANSDVLVGLDINPTFTNGAFTGVTNAALRTVTGNVLLATTSGNVGIGTTTIGSKLQINGNAAIGYSASTAAPTNGLAVSGIVNINNTTNTAWQQFISSSTITNTFYTSSAAQTINGIDNTSGASGASLLKFYINGIGKFTTGVDGASNSYKISTTDINTNTRLAIDASGNIGINTTTFGASQFQINGSTAIGYSASTAAPTNGLVVSGTTLIGSTTDNGTDKLQVTGSTKVTGAATFSSSVTATGNISTSGIYVGRTTNGQAFGCGNGVDSDLGIYVQANNILFTNTGTSTGFSFAIGGTTRFSIAGTGAATFSSSVTAGGDVSIGYNNAFVLGGSPYRYKIYRSNAGSLETYFDDEYDINSTALNFRFRTSGTPITALRIASTGAATFSSSVTATQLQLTGTVPSGSFGIYTNLTIGTSSPIGMYLSPNYTTAVTGYVTDFAISPTSDNGTRTTAQHQGLVINDISKGTGHTITDNYGLIINNIAAGTNNTALAVGMGLSQFLDKIELSSTLKLGAYSVAGLPTAGTAGRIAYVTDALAPTYGATVVGGGSVKTLVFDNGTNWTVH